VFFEVPQNDRCDQIAGDGKENIDAGEPARKSRHTEMIEYDGDHCDRAEPVNVGPIFDS